MLKIENMDIHGWEAAVRGMRNPKNSWEKSDSYYEIHASKINYGAYVIGENDLKLMQALAGAGADHGKFLRMITVTCDITAPLYWWKEFDTYKVGTVANSCSTMHKIHSREFTLDDFSHEHLRGDSENALKNIIEQLNFARIAFLETKDKGYWWEMIQLLPSSYNQRRTIMLNYEVLRRMYHARKEHKLDEWRETFCDWVRGLPYAKELIIGGMSDGI